MLFDRLRLPHVEPVDTPEADREAAIVLITATFSLLVFAYWGRPGWYNGSELGEWVTRNIGGPFADFPRVGGYVWWGITSTTLRLLAPLAIIVWVIRRRPVEYGYRLRGIASHVPMYAVFYLVMLPVLIWASSFASFRSFYPFYERASEGGTAFWLYELGYLTQFIGLEAFFRGFLTFGLVRRFGMLSIVVMTVPYTMIHFGKPMPEATAAIFAGLILGYMALRTRSFVPGIFLHAGVAITMDLLVLWRNGFLDNIF